MTHDVKLCAVCAWRATCNKKFSLGSQVALRCVDFARDITIPIEDDKLIKDVKKEK
ncbi:MAG: hypothetical protein SVW57_06250 [Thermodesulfobacteriota bacterium]|nr:hypothetical protein [Thermodesulfobacteriota bacterium]